MKLYRVSKHSNLDYSRSSSLMFLLFMTGILLGALAGRYLGLSANVFSGNLDKPLGYVSGDFAMTLISMAKFLLMLYLLAFEPWGAMLIPPVFGIEGFFFGASVSGFISGMGFHGAVLAALLLMFRLSVVVPYGFLLGAWSVKQSLGFSSTGRREHFAGVLAVTAAVILLSAFLECSLARWLGGMYYLKFGV